MESKKLQKIVPPKFRVKGELLREVLELAQFVSFLPLLLKCGVHFESASAKETHAHQSMHHEPWAF